MTARVAGLLLELAEPTETDVAGVVTRAALRAAYARRWPETDRPHNPRSRHGSDGARSSKIVSRSLLRLETAGLVQRRGHLVALRERVTLRRVANGALAVDARGVVHEVARAESGGTTRSPTARGLARASTRGSARRRLP